MASLDERTQKDYGIPAALLMENAGRTATEYLLKAFRAEPVRKGPILLVAGKGNNGGDALVIARHLFLAGVRDLEVLLTGEDLGELPGLHAGILGKLGIPLKVFEGREARELFARAGLIVDGLFGIGLSGRLRPQAEEIVELMNSSGARIVSLDLPSGLFDGFRPDYPAVKADLTLTFELPKLCQYLPAGRPLCGRIEILPVGFPPDLIERMTDDYELLDEAFPEKILPPLAPAAYKNTRGHLAVFAGSRGTTGAASLCSEAALRSGTGLVSLFADEAVYPILTSSARSVMVKPLPNSTVGWDARRHSAFLLGPGWGRGPERETWLQALLESSLPGVIDADGLSVLKTFLEKKGPEFSLAGRILTPHPGEFAVFLGRTKEEVLADPFSLVREAARKYDCVVVLKGHVTYISSPSGKIRIHDGMNPYLGTAGSGDVLAGILAGLLARGLPPEEAAAAGVEFHGRLGRLAKKEIGFFLAEDLLPLISGVIGKNELQ